MLQPKHHDPRPRPSLPALLAVAILIGLSVPVASAQLAGQSFNKRLDDFRSSPVQPGLLTELCHAAADGSGPARTIEVAPFDVQRYLDAGASLGACPTDDTGECTQFFGGLPPSGQTICYDPAGGLFVGQIDCEGSGQDGEYTADRSLNFVDNGDGTITDENSGLMWEKKDRSGGLQDVDRAYTWPNALAYVRVINSTCEGAGFVTCGRDLDCDQFCGYAGYRDWRLPNVRELHSLIDFSIPAPGPTVTVPFRSGCEPGCTVLDCSCTSTRFHWSSTSSAVVPTNAWIVAFSSGLSGTNQKVNEQQVRAVRGGARPPQPRESLAGPLPEGIELP